MLSETASTEPVFPSPPVWDASEDTDQDGLRDEDEMLLFDMDPLDPEDGLADDDGDGLTTADEFFYQTDPDLADTDGDSWNDCDELMLHSTDPRDPQSFPQGDGVQNPDTAESSDSFTNIAPQTLASLEQETPPASLSDGDFDGIEVTGFKYHSGKDYQGNTFDWGTGATNVNGWEAYQGSKIEVWQVFEVWDSNPIERFIELDGWSGHYGVKQAIKNTAPGSYVLTWQHSGRTNTQAGDNAYSVKVYYLTGETEVEVANSGIISGIDKTKWTPNGLGFSITQEQIAAAGDSDFYVAFILVGNNTYGTLIDKVGLVAEEFTLYQRGMINAPGAVIPRRADSNEVYEVVTLENADFDEQTEWTPNSMASAHETNRQDGITEDVNMESDDDFVKIRLHMPLPQMPGSIELVMDKAGQGSRMQANDLRFYNDQGQRVLLDNLKISDLQNPHGPLAPMLQADGLDLFVEIADLGQITRISTQATRDHRRYADLILRLTVGGQLTEMRARIYRGGYWRNQRDGNTGTIAFYDGKGRYQDRNGAWQIDVGNLVHGPFDIQSGVNGVVDETRENAGPTPIEWYGLFERLDINQNWQFSQRTQRWSRPQQDHNYNHPSGRQPRPRLQDATGQYWQQGSYSQWSIAGNRTQYTHRGTTPPPSVQFKFELVNWGHNAHGRNLLQIHPDGWNDGTAGCVGLQNYNECCQVFFLLRHYFGTRIHIETP